MPKKPTALPPAYVTEIHEQMIALVDAARTGCRTPSGMRSRGSGTRSAG